jgi:hypothetical protein
LFGVCGLVALAVWAAAPAGASRAQQRDAARQFLATTLGIGAADLARIDSGAVVAHALDAEDRREVAVRGVVHIRVPADFYLERVADIVSFKKHEAVQQIGVFGDPPRVEDLQGLTLDRGDLSDLRHCEPDDCDMNLPAETMARFRQEVAWSAPAAEAQANHLMREFLARYVADYRLRGDEAPMRYADEDPPIDTTAEYEALAARGSHLLDEFPGLAAFARDYPHGRRDGVRDFFYWSKEKPGPSPTVTVTHFIMWPVHLLRPGSPVRHAILSRQIYGSRYFDASMGLTLLIPDPANPGGATFVVYLNRSRLDVFGGLLGGIIRRTVRGRVRSGMAESLGRVKAALEREAAGGKLEPPAELDAAARHSLQTEHSPCPVGVKKGHAASCRHLLPSQALVCCGVFAAARQTSGAS